MTSFNIYLLFVIGNINIGLTVLFVVTCLASGIGLFCWCMHFDGVYSDDRTAYKKMGKRWLKRSIVILSISFTGMIFCPPTEQLAVIYLIPKLSNTKLVKTLPAYAQTFLDLEIKKLKKETLEASK